MPTTFDNSSHTNASLSIANGSDVVFLPNSIWTMTTSAAILTLNGSNQFRNGGQLYGNSTAVRGTASSIQIENLAAGVISSSTGAAISLVGGGHDVTNAGYIAGLNAIVFETGGAVFNAGMLVSEDTTIVFGLTASDQEVVNDGSIVSSEGGAITFASTGWNTLFNTGTITVDDVVVEVRGDGPTVITNSGAINGLYAMLLRSGDDIVVNTGTIVGISALGEGDDLFDSGDGVVNGLVAGQDGDDTLIGGASSDQLDGGLGADLLIGNGGNDLLEGGPGGDELDGGPGRDTADYRDGSEVIVDLADPGANSSIAAGDIFISVENLLGSSGADQFFGDDVRNVLRGGEGDDLLDGRGGADRLVGGFGNDIYVIENARDQAVEIVGGGVDLVRAKVSFTLPGEVENLTLIGTAATDALGNALGNMIVGNGGANAIDGGLGNDVLTGGGGADVFRFTTALGASNQDIVEDFVSGTDRIALSRAIFTEVGGGATLGAGRFVIGTAGAQDANDRIIYNPANGGLYYDPDGTGSASQVLFAAFDSGLALTAGDFQLVG